MLWLLAALDSPGRCKGRALCRGGGLSRDWSFSSASSFAAKLPLDEDDLTVLANAPMDAHGAEGLLGALSKAPMAYWCADDLAYLMGLPAPYTLDELSTLADAAATWLASIPDDLLVQTGELVQEAGEQGRLGGFIAELHARHDPLSMPPAGSVDLAPLCPRRGETGAPPRQDIAPDILERVFEAREALANAFAAYEERPQQIEMAFAAAQALADSQPLIVEAGTGVGKSIAYLLPLAIHAAETGQLCLVSTNTINLQEQLVSLDVPRMQSILDMLDLRVTLLKGREHYLCLKRLRDVWLTNAPGSRQRRQALLARGPASLLFIVRLLLAHVQEPHGDLDRLPAPPSMPQALRAAVMAGVDCRYTTCLGDRCELKARCHFFTRRAEAASSHIVITNHALVFALHNLRDDDADNVLTRAPVIVFDEAHNLEQAITGQNTLSVSNELPIDFGNRLLELLQHQGCRQRLALKPGSAGEESAEALERAQAAAEEVPSWIRLAAEIKGQVARLLEQAVDKGHVRQAEPEQLTPPLASPGQAQVLDLLSKLAERLRAVLLRFRALARDIQTLFTDEESELYLDDTMFQMDLQWLGADLDDACLALAHWHPDDPEAVTWFNCDLREAEAAWEFKTAPLHVGPVFQSLLASKECVILCGATLTVAGKFDYLQACLGFDPATTGRSRWLRLSSPFDYPTQSLLLAATDVATPTGETREQYLEQLEEVVAGVCEVFPQGVLVLFNSHRDLRHIASRLPLRVAPERILVQGESGSRHEIAEVFRSAGDKVLLATRSFWEGFDVSGEALSCVVLAKLPFGNYRDPIHAGRQRAIDAAGGDSFREYSLPIAVMQLRQGFGRLIRSKSDYGCVFILDSRVVRARYGRVFLDSLPGPQTITGTCRECLEAAARFMEERRG